MVSGAGEVGASAPRLPGGVGVGEGERKREREAGSHFDHLETLLPSDEQPMTVRRPRHLLEAIDPRRRGEITAAASVKPGQDDPASSVFHQGDVRGGAGGRPFRKGTPDLEPYGPGPGVVHLPP